MEQVYLQVRRVLKGLESASHSLGKIHFHDSKLSLLHGPGDILRPGPPGM